MKILENRKVYSNGSHCAFTDLILFQDKYYLCFRTGKKHMSECGKLRVFESKDTLHWKEMPFPNIKGDVRDCKFADVVDTLNVFFPVRNKDKVNSYSSAMICNKWNCPILLRENWVICRPTYIGNKLASPYWLYVHNNFKENEGALMLITDNEKRMLHWGNKINETELVPLEDNIIVISRTENNFTMIGKLDLTKGHIEWRRSDFILHAPCAKQINGKWIVAARDARSCMAFEPDMPKKDQCWTETIRLYELNTATTGLEYNLNLFRGVKADCGYCGIAEDKKDKRNCYISYYRGAGNKADIYIAKVRV